MIEPDGRELRAVRVSTWHKFEPDTRLAVAATLDCDLEDGSTRRFHIGAMGDSRTCLGPGLYCGFDGHCHGEYRGKIAVDGERIDDTTNPDGRTRIHQLQDVIARVRNDLPPYGRRGIVMPVRNFVFVSRTMSPEGGKYGERTEVHEGARRQP